MGIACLLKHVTEGKIEGTGGQGRIRKQLLDNNLKGKRKILELEKRSSRWHSLEN
jgi:hypothetical protein